eukprot:jgi/Botrbrau1/18535/Bobra.0596s0002.1
MPGSDGGHRDIKARLSMLCTPKALIMRTTELARHEYKQDTAVPCQFPRYPAQSLPSPRHNHSHKPRWQVRAATSAGELCGPQTKSHFKRKFPTKVLMQVVRAGVAMRVLSGAYAGPTPHAGTASTQTPDCQACLAFHALVNTHDMITFRGGSLAQEDDVRDRRKGYCRHRPDSAS